MFIISGSFA